MKKLASLSSLAAAASLLTPVLAFAQRGGFGCNIFRTNAGSLEYMICKVGDLLNLVIPILVVLGILFFVWGVVQYVINKEEEAKKKGRDRMIFGIIGLVVIVAMWGLVNLVLRTFALDPTQTIPSEIPTVPF